MEVQWSREELKQLEKTVSDAQNDANQLKKFLAETVQRQLMLGWNGAAGEAYINRLEIEIKRLQDISGNLALMSEGISNVSKSYRACEENIRKELGKL